MARYEEKSIAMESMLELLRKQELGAIAEAIRIAGACAQRTCSHF